MNAEAQKRAAGEAAARLVEGGMTVGLGTGSTAAWFVRALAGRVQAERGFAITGIATSAVTAALAASLGLRIVDLDAAGRIDLTVDGADEIGPGLALIKGAGAAMLHEKLVWIASDRCVVIADAGKPVPALGRSLLPMEVVAFGHATTAARIAATLEGLGVHAAPRLRLNGADPVRTDSGNLIYDLPCGEIADPPALAAALKAVTGVVEHGLFLGLAERALVGTNDGVIELYP